MQNKCFWSKILIFGRSLMSRSGPGGGIRNSLKMGQSFIKIAILQPRIVKKTGYQNSNLFIVWESIQEWALVILDKVGTIRGWIWAELAIANTIQRWNWAKLGQVDTIQGWIWAYKVDLGSKLAKTSSFTV